MGLDSVNSSLVVIIHFFTEFKEFTIHCNYLLTEKKK